MVWVSNRASVAIGVWISNTTTGSNSWYTINANIAEVAAINRWHRTGAETAHVRIGGEVKAVFTVEPNYHVDVFNGSVEISKPIGSTYYFV